jgi:hypothetical protein
MASRIRVLDSANSTMQRLGFLKALAALVNETETSNLETLGRRFVARVTQRVKLTPPYDDDLKEYARTRLTDGAYRELRKKIMEDAGPAGVELQDVYLADKSLPSSTGKLVQANWRNYPYLATSLEIVKKGTYSGLTRSLVLLAVTPKEELAAFAKLDKQNNPLRISECQAAVLLYCLLDNDAAVAVPLLRALVQRGERFDERFAGDMLPDILREVVASYAKRSLPAEEKDRLSMLGKIATNIAKWKGKAYTGGGARQEAIRVRLEPYCDLGLLQKPNREKFEYEPTHSAQAFMSHYGRAPDIDEFLQNGFFAAVAACRGVRVRPANDDEAIKALSDAGQALKSTLGYTPLTDVGLLAGTWLLTDRHCVLELGRTVELLKTLQKQDPSFVRFTVDRMGVLAYVKFLKTEPGGSSARNRLEAI